MDFLSQAVGPLSLGQWIGVLVALLVVFPLLNKLGSWSKRHGEQANLGEAKCLGCGWKGRVSKYHRTCPRCGNAITRLSRGEV